MIDYYLPPVSIECKAANLKSRKILPKKPVSHKSFKKILFKCTLDYNSEAIIDKELVPKKAIIDDKSLLDKGTSINGDSISVLSEKPLRRDNTTIKKGSSTHKASFLNTRAYTYAKLEKEYRKYENISIK